jgi:hypothetical protein
MKIEKIKIIIIITIIVFILFFILILSGLLPSNKKTQVTPIIPTHIPYPTYIQPSFPPVTIPPTTQETIQISDVIVNNFYKDGRLLNKNGDVNIAENEKYEIQYQKPFQLFLITILSAPFEEIRVKAEQDFLTSLGIDQSHACKLHVIVGTPNFVDPQLSKVDFPLSFCAPGNN